MTEPQDTGPEVRERRKKAKGPFPCGLGRTGEGDDHPGDCSRGLRVEERRGRAAARAREWDTSVLCLSEGRVCFSPSVQGSATPGLL